MLFPFRPFGTPPLPTPWGYPYQQELDGTFPVVGGTVTKGKKAFHLEDDSPRRSSEPSSLAASCSTTSGTGSYHTVGRWPERRTREGGTRSRGSADNDGLHSPREGALARPRTRPARDGKKPQPSLMTVQICPTCGLPTVKNRSNTSGGGGIRTRVGLRPPVFKTGRSFPSMSAYVPKSPYYVGFWRLPIP